MKRPLPVWLTFGACVVVGLAVLGWFTREMLRMEHTNAEARRIAAVEENARLALWRIDSALAVIQGTEAARAEWEYSPFRPVSANDTGAASAPSPLLGHTPAFVRLHVQLDENGRLSSPQVVSGNARRVALASGTTPQQLAAAAAALERFRGLVDEPLLWAMAQGAERAKDQEIASGRQTERDALLDTATVGKESLLQAANEPVAEAQLQNAKSELELQRREELRTQQSVANYADNRSSFSKLFRSDSAPTAAKDTQATPEPSRARAKIGSPAAVASAPAAAGASYAPPSAEGTGVLADAAEAAAASDLSDEALDESLAEQIAGPMQAIWMNGALLLVRRANAHGSSVVQTVWLDWAELRPWLLSRVTDLLPEAQLVPVPGDAHNGPGLDARRLAFLPVRLLPGALPTASLVTDTWSPLRTSLATAWISAAIGVAALALLLRGTLRLSERRGAFVSAVTHELRTPLTTFRMYTEMLASGMVRDEEKRRDYLGTLQRESERLSHLVENVLGYSRIERGRAARRVEDTTPAELVSRVEPRLRDRLVQAEMELRLKLDPASADRELRTDTTAVEQVLFNLVDNAAKYGRPTNPERPAEVVIESSRTARGRLRFRISDHGPGISQSVRKRLFQPFSKSASEAAQSQPGVGLGLALCRRLAREELHGELALEKTGPDGTTFRLELPVG